MTGRKLGMLINTDKHTEDVVGIAKAAVAKGNSVVIFMMDDGVKLSTDQTFKQLVGMDGISLSLCEHSCHVIGHPVEEIPEGIIRGSQYNNALMNHECDKVIVL